MSEDVFMKPGIYLDMDEGEYFRDPSIGGSSLKNIIQTPEEYWWDSPFNKIDRRPDRETKSQALGTLIHKIMLEGVDAYNDTYAVALDSSHYPDALHTTLDIQGALDKLGVSYPSSSRKQQLIDSLLEVSPNALVWDDMKQRHSLENDGKITVARHLDAKARIMQRIAERDPSLSKLFSTGLPEVSVFWRDLNDVPCRMRVDWLTVSKTVDLKSYNPRSKSKRRETNWANAIDDMGYHYQEGHYRAGRLAMPKLPIIGGSKAAKEYVRECLNFSDPSFSFVFAKTDGAPHIEEVWTTKDIWTLAMEDRDRALLKWADMRDAFGFDAPWFSPSSGGVALDETCFRSSLGAY